MGERQGAPLRERERERERERKRLENQEGKSK